MKGISLVNLKIKRINDALSVIIVILCLLISFNIYSSLHADRELYFVTSEGKAILVKYSDATNTKIKQRIYEYRNQ